MPRPNPAITWAVLGILFLYAAAGLLVSFAPAELMVRQLGGLSGSGEAAAQITGRYATLVSRARLTSALLLLLWALLVWQRHRLDTALAAAGHRARALLAALPGRLHRAARTAWRDHRGETLVFLAILAIGTALRLAYLDRDIRHDEAWTYMVYGRRPLYLAPLILSDVNHHPLNTILIHLSVALFGNPAWAIRLPAFLFGVGCIPAAYALARAVAAPVQAAAVAALTAALVAGAPALVEYSVNARGYSAVAFCTLVMMVAGQRGIRRGSGPALALMVAAAAIGTYANIVMLLPGIMAFCWFAALCLEARGPARRAAFARVVVGGLGVAALTLLLYVPFFTVNGWDAILASQGIKARAGVLAAMATLPAYVSGLTGDWGRDLGPAPIWALLALAAAALVLVPRPAVLGLGAGIAGAVLFQIGLVRDPGPARVWLSLLPVVSLLAALGLARLLATVRAPLPAASVAVAAAMALAVLHGDSMRASIETGYFPGARAVATALAGMTESDRLATLVVRGDDVAYYALRQGLRLDVVQTQPPLRIYRPVGAPPNAGPGRLSLLLDKALGFCSPAACTDQAETLVPVQSPPQTIQDTPGWTLLQAERRR